jgi:hypothetical protein
MKVLKSLPVLLIISFLLLPQASVTPVQARPPDFFEVTIDTTLPLKNHPCGFPISDNTYMVQHVQQFFDKDGNRIRLHVIYGQMNESWSANGKSLELQNSGPLHWEFVSETEVIESFRGAFIITVPGFGRVYGRAGNVTWKWDTTGDIWTLVEVLKETGPFIQNWDFICDYLGP